MKCCYRSVIYNHSVISLEIRETEIMGMYRENLYSRQIQTSPKSTHDIPQLKMKDRGNLAQKSRPQYVYNSQASQ